MRHSQSRRKTRRRRSQSRRRSRRSRRRRRRRRSRRRVFKTRPPPIGVVYDGDLKLPSTYGQRIETPYTVRAERVGRFLVMDATPKPQRVGRFFIYSASPKKTPKKKTPKKKNKTPRKRGRFQIVSLSPPTPRRFTFSP